MNAESKRKTQAIVSKFYASERVFIRLAGFNFWPGTTRNFNHRLKISGSLVFVTQTLLANACAQYSNSNFSAINGTQSAGLSATENLTLG